MTELLYGLQNCGRHNEVARRMNGAGEGGGGGRSYSMVGLHGLTIDPGEKIRGCQQLNSISIGQNTFH